MSCGIEAYKYLTPVDPGIPLTLNTEAYIKLPNFDASQIVYFRYFTIYYRIYISDIPVEGTVSIDQLSAINPALFTDYHYFLPYTNVDSSVIPTSMGAMFLNRKYYTLALETANIETVLNNSAAGTSITLDFARSTEYRPSLIMGDIRTPPALGDPPYVRYQLFRHSDGTIHPYANNRYFVNSSDINNGDHINTETFYNLDVQKDAGMSGPKYTYAAMYILSYGIDAETGFSNVYSIPTFIGVFRLPEE